MLHIHTHTDLPTYLPTYLQFEWVLPGHGEPHHFPTAQSANISLRQGLHWMQSQPAGHTPLLQFFAWLKIRTKVRRPLLLWLNNRLLMPTGR